MVRRDNDSNSIINLSPIVGDEWEGGHKGEFMDGKVEDRVHGGRGCSHGRPRFLEPPCVIKCEYIVPHHNFKRVQDCRAIEVKVGQDLVVMSKKLGNDVHRRTK